LRVGSLFSGIGGFDLGLERTGGFRTAWFCEQDEFCQRVLARHWPGVPCHPDITALTGDAAGPVDVLCGGFPCQDLSYAGLGAGLAGARSGLWSEYARLIGELGPRYIVVENVSALLARGLGTVLADLAALGYDAEWDCIPASAVGAPHRRDRIWLVAYPRGEQHQGAGDAERPPASAGLPQDLADTQDIRYERSRAARDGRHGSADGCRDGGVGHTDRASAYSLAATGASREAASQPGWWAVEPDVGRVAHGVPARVDRLRSLGNALVPQIAEWIGRRILNYEGGLT
jgi:DNA (cytosine-5)-methyltransferase 1